MQNKFTDMMKHNKDMIKSIDEYQFLMFKQRELFDNTSHLFMEELKALKKSIIKMYKPLFKEAVKCHDILEYNQIFSRNLTYSQVERYTTYNQNFKWSDFYLIPENNVKFKQNPKFEFIHDIHSTFGWSLDFSGNKNAINVFVRFLKHYDTEEFHKFFEKYPQIVPQTVSFQNLEIFE